MAFIQAHSGYITVRGFVLCAMNKKNIAAAEAKKIRSIKGYRTPATVLKKLAESRLELILEKKAVQFDVTDLSRAYAAHFERSVQ